MRAGADHRARAAGVLGAAATLAWSALVARRREVSDREAAIFRWFNNRSDRLAAPAWGVAQAGSLGAVFVAVGIVHRGGRPGEARCVGVAGVGVWLGVKLIKPLVDRGRPADHLDGVVVRGQPQRGLGYPSGHAAVSTVLALVSTGRSRWRGLALAVAMVTGSSRMYTGAHLPLDVVGGVATGAVVGTVTNAVRSCSRNR